MSRIAVLGLVVLGLIGLVAPRAGQGQSPGAAAGARMAAARKSLSDLSGDLREAQGIVKGLSDPRLRDRLELLLTRAQLRASELEKTLPTLAAPTGYGPSPLVGPADLDDLIRALKKETFDNKRVPFIQNLGPSRRYTSTQVAALLRTFDFDDGRAQAAVVLYPQVIDPENFYKALDVFTFDSGKQKVREQLKLK